MSLSPMTACCLFSFVRGFSQIFRKKCLVHDVVHEANNPAWVCVVLHTCGERRLTPLLLALTLALMHVQQHVCTAEQQSVCACVFFVLPVNIHNNNVILYTSIRAGSTRDTDSYLRHGLSPTQQCTYIPEGGIFFLTALACSTAVRGQQQYKCCLLYTSPSPRDATLSRMPSSA